MNYQNPSFSVGSTAAVRANWDKVFGKKDEASSCGLGCPCAGGLLLCRVLGGEAVEQCQQRKAA